MNEDSITANIAQWTRQNAEFTDPAARRHWASEEIFWGVFSIPEPEIDVIGDVDGLDVVELGCGTAYFSAWLAKRGARPVGVDPTPAQLETARRCMRETGIEFPLVEAYGEAVPLPDAAFDLVLSEYGAAIWADPYAWIPEASRLLRPGGRLVFLGNSPISLLCSPATGPVLEQLQRPQFGMHRFDWTSDNDGIAFWLAHGDWIRLLRANAFDVLDLIEIYPAADADTHEFYGYVPAAWGRQWPSEEILVASKR
jgi:SAM-dependent methyltransferase